MTNLLRIATISCAAAVAFGSGAAAYAQGVSTPSEDGRGVQRDFAMDHRAGEPGGRWMHRDPLEMQKHAADHLRTILQLSAQQEPALQTFLASMKPPEREHHKNTAAHDGASAPTDPSQLRSEMQARHAEMAKARDAESALTAPQRLDVMMKHMAERQAKLEAHVMAVKTFYAALTPPQQKVFDTLHGREGRMDNHRPEGRMGEGGPRSLAYDFGRPFGRSGPEHADARSMGPPQPGER